MEADSHIKHMNQPPAASLGQRAALEKCFHYLGEQIKRETLNESAAHGAQALSKEIASVLDAYAATAKDAARLKQAFLDQQLLLAAIVRQNGGIVRIDDLTVAEIDRRSSIDTWRNEAAKQTVVRVSEPAAR